MCTLSVAERCQESRWFPQAAQEGKGLVVVGSSFIGMELVTALSKRKLASIDVIGTNEFPFEAVLGKAIGAGFKKVLFSLCHQFLIC